MKKPALLLAALLTTGASLFAAEPASSYSITADFPYVSKYVFRGLQAAEGAFQPSVKVTKGDFYAGLWSSMPVDNGYELEIDYYVGYGLKLSDTVSLDTGVTVYHYPGLDTPGAAKVTYEGYVGVNSSWEGVNFGLYAYNDFKLDVFTLQGNIGYSIPIDEKISMNFAGSLGRTYPDAGSGYTYYNIGLQFPYKVSDTITFTAGANWASHDFDGLEDNHLWFNAGLTVSF